MYQLKVHAHGQGAWVATINHGFSAAMARDEGLDQTFLDPLHPNAPWADELLALVAHMLADDRAYHRRLEAHYALVKKRSRA